MNLTELKLKQISEVIEIAESLGLENVARSRKQDLIFAILKKQAKAGDDISGDGVLEILQDGFGFLRTPGCSYLAGPDDIYVSPSQIRRFSLKTGDTITGKISLYTFTTACRDINFRSRVDIKDKLDHNKQALDKITTLFSEITPTGTQLEVDEEEKVDKLEPDMLDVKNNLAIVKADINSSRPDCLNVMPMPSSIPNLLYANGVWDDNAIKIPKQPNFQNRAEDAIEIRNENRAKEMDKRRFSRNSTIGTGDMTTEGGSRHKSRRHLANNKTKVKNQIRSKMVRRKKTKKVVKRRQTRKAARNH